MTMKTWIAPSLAVLALAMAGCGSSTPESETAASEEAAPAETAGSETSSLPEITVTAEELEGNPFLAEWDTPYGVPPFAEISDEDYMPAIKQGILEAREGVAAIASNPDAPTFENTILPLETGGELVNKVAYVFGNITNTDTNDTLRGLESEIWPMLTRETDAVYLNPVIFERVKTVHDQLDTLDLDQQQKRLVELTYRDFERAGAALDADTKAQVADINAQISGLTTRFGQNLLASTKAFRMELTTPEDIAGLSQDFLAGIQVPGEEKWVITLDRSVYETFMTQSENRELRRRAFDGYRLRASEGEYDNGPVLIEIAQLRAKRAELLGYRSHAAYQLETRMAKTPRTSSSASGARGWSAPGKNAPTCRPWSAMPSRSPARTGGTMPRRCARRAMPSTTMRSSPISSSARCATGPSKWRTACSMSPSRRWRSRAGTRWCRASRSPTMRPASCSACSWPTISPAIPSAAVPG